MATTNLDFILQAQDRVSGQIKTLNGNLQGLNDKQGESVTASGNSGGAYTKLKGKINEVSGSVGGLIGQFALGNIAAQGVQKIFEGISGTIHEAITEQEDWQTQQARAAAQVKQTGTIHGETKEKLVDLAEATEKHTTVSKVAVLTGVNMLDTYGNISSKVLPAATDALTRLASATNGGVIPSAQQMNTTAIQLGIALNDPSVAYTRLRREGVTFTEQQKDQLKTMVASGNTFGAQKLLISAIDNQYASLSAQQNTYKFALSQLHNIVIDFLGGALKKLVGMLQTLATFLLAHKPILAAVAGAFIGLGIAIGVVVVTALWSLIGAAIIAVASLWPIIAIGAAIGLIAYEVITHWDTLKKYFDKFWSDVKQWFNDGVNFIKGVWDGVKHVFDVSVGFIKNFFKIEWDGVKAIWNGVTGFFKDVFDGITKRIKGAVGFISDGFKVEFNTVARYWNDTLGKLSVKVPSWVPGIGGKGFDFPKIPTFAGGTQNFKGGWAVVGEQGAELVNMPQGTQITPANQTSQLMNAAKGSNTQPSQTVNIDLQIGMYAGLPSEKRKIAVDLYREVVREARSHNVQLPQIGSAGIQ